MAKTFFDFCMEHGDTSLLEQWDTLANDSLTPHDVPPNSHKKIWWRCDKGHSWQAVVYKRKNSKLGCPYCHGKKPILGETDLASKHPILAAQWHPEKNGDLTPSQVASRSARKVWWICSLDHEYQAAVAARTNMKSGCPYCANKKVLPGFNDLATLHPKLATQWHPTLNGDLTPSMVTPGSSKKAWWICGDGHVWKTFISSRGGKQQTNCPVCAGKVKRNKE